MAMAIAVDTPATCKVEPVSWYVCAGTATTSSPIPSSEINRAEKAYLKGRLVRKGETSITSTESSHAKVWPIRSRVAIAPS